MPKSRKVAPMLEYVPLALVVGMAAYVFVSPNMKQK